MNRRRIALGVSSVSGLAVVAAGAVSMFGSGGSANAVDLHATPAAAVSDAAGATEKAGTAQIDTVVTVATPAVPAQGRTPAVPTQTQTMHGTGGFDFGKQMAAIDVTLPTETLNEVLTPATVYLRRSATAATPKTAAVPATPWTWMATAGMPDGNLFSDGATQPSLVFAMLGGTQPGVKYVGQDVVRGVPVAHYQGTLDLTQAAQALSASAAAKTAAGTAAAAEKQTLTNAARALITTKVPFDVYLDAQGRLRRFVGIFSSHIERGAARPVAQITSATEVYGFGTPVTVVRPSGAVAAPSGVGRPSGSQSSPAHRSTPSAHPTSHTRSHK